MRNLRISTLTLVLAAGALAAPVSVVASSPPSADDRAFEIQGLVLGHQKIDADGKLSIQNGTNLVASVGCNTIGGSVTVAGDSVTIDGPLLMTEMACPGVDAGTEDALVKVLGLGPFQVSSSAWVGVGGEILVVELPGGGPAVPPDRPTGTTPGGPEPLPSCPPGAVDGGGTTGSGGGSSGSGNVDPGFVPTASDPGGAIECLALDVPARAHAGTDGTAVNAGDAAVPPTEADAALRDPSANVTLLGLLAAAIAIALSAGVLWALRRRRLASRAGTTLR
ncbi:MAG TPA: META domain-containing protein [Candidatus Limnocylindrales bacterium]|nr:META domain-containing protein [Candidatus Limnocylindrales bacterium]